MLPALQSLIDLQSIDTAAETARRRLAELPAAEQLIEVKIATAVTAVDGIKASLHANHQARRELEREVSLVETRLARFDDHKAAVKTNQEYQALLHEISVAKGEKDAVEERILISMEEADDLNRKLKAAESALVQGRRDGDTERTALAQERTNLEAELSRLAGERARQVDRTDAAILAKYEQLMKSRRGIAVTQITGDVCSACHVRLRPHVAQVVRRNEEIVQCESCHRVLYYAPPPGS